MTYNYYLCGMSITYENYSEKITYNYLMVLIV